MSTRLRLITFDGFDRKQPVTDNNYCHFIEPLFIGARNKRFSDETLTLSLPVQSSWIN
jgi:hypothetical protein